MLRTIVIVLVILWLLGMIGGSTFGGAIHAILVIGIVLLVIDLLQSRRG